MSDQQNIVNEALVKNVLAVVDQGLVQGVGEPIPGKMCVEAAVCYAMGLPHGDEPTCVGEAVRKFKIVLNDFNWSSNEARAQGMRQLAVAQLGSDQIDQVEFAKEVALETIRQIVPIALRAAASFHEGEHKEALERAALACEVSVDLNAASYAAARAVGYASDAARAVDAGSYAGSYAASTAGYAAARTAATAATAASWADAGDADAGYAAARAASWAGAGDSVLKRCAKIGLKALIKLASPGAAFLALCDD